MLFEELILIQSKSSKQDTRLVFTGMTISKSTGEWLKKIKCEQSGAQVNAFLNLAN